MTGVDVELALLVAFASTAVAKIRFWWASRPAPQDACSKHVDAYLAGCDSDFGDVADVEEGPQDRMFIAETMPGAVAAFHPAVLEAEQVMAKAVQTVVPFGPLRQQWFTPLQRGDRAE